MEKQTALLLIDIQIGFFDIEYWGGNRNNLNAERNSAKILEVWRRNDWPIIHINITPQIQIHLYFQVRKATISSDL